jgi:signal transduction histidine kinase
LEIEEMLAESIRIARSLSTDLSPPILHAAGIAAGLEWLARWMADMHEFSPSNSILKRARISTTI